MIATPGLDVTYQGQPKQRRWHACPAYESGFGGAKFGGKTLGLLMESTRYTSHPRYRGIIFRRTYPQLQEVLDRAWQWFPRMGASWSGDTHAWTFPSGAKLLMRHCQYEHDRENYNGHEYQFMGFDQLEQFTETQYTYLLAQNRSGVADLVPYTRSTFNPGGIGHGWVKQRFIDRGSTTCSPWRDRNDVGKPLPTRCFHFSSIDDNPAGEAADPTYRSRLENLPEEERRGLLYGDWDIFAGQFFGEWRRGVHTCDAFELPPHWTCRGWSVDWGYGAPWSCHFWVRDEDLWASHKLERWIAYREFYETRVSDHDQAARIAAAIAADEEQAAEQHKTLAWSAVGDPSMWNAKPNSTVSVAHVYESEPHFLSLRKGNNDRRQGWNRMRSYLAAERVLPNGRRVPVAPGGRPLLQFMRQHCPHAVRTIPSLVFDAINKEDIAQGPEVEDHAADEVRYWLMSRSNPMLVALLSQAVDYEVTFDARPIPVDPTVAYRSRPTEDLQRSKNAYLEQLLGTGGSARRTMHSGDEHRAYLMRQAMGGEED